MRFDDALHEFDTIKGVKEDVTDVILNLKDLVLTCIVRGSGAAAPRRARPGGRHRPRHPDHHPTSRSSTRTSRSQRSTQKGRLAIDLTVEQGRGYASAEKTKTAGAPIGEIPVDAIFSPVRRVAFDIEPTRVEQATNYDKLGLEIETDGSITPREALASAGATLRNLVGLVADMSEEQAGLELGEVSPITGDLARPRARRSRSSTSPSARATASSGPASTPSASSCRRPRTTSSRSRTSARSRLDEVIVKLDERGLSLRMKD